MFLTALGIALKLIERDKGPMGLMRKVLILSVALFVAASAMVFGFAGMGRQVALAGDTECRGTLGAVTIQGNVIVPDDSQCTLSGTNVQGAVVVKSRSTLIATGITATGGVQGQSATKVMICDSVIGNSISLTKGGDFGGSIGLHNNQINGDIQLQDNRQPIQLLHNSVSGSIAAQGNVAGVEIIGNGTELKPVNGVQCQDNMPAPEGSGNYAHQFQGQCPAPQFSTTIP